MTSATFIRAIHALAWGGIFACVGCLVALVWFPAPTLAIVSICISLVAVAVSLVSISTMRGQWRP